MKGFWKALFTGTKTNSSQEQETAAAGEHMRLRKSSIYVFLFLVIMGLIAALVLTNPFKMLLSEDAKAARQFCEVFRSWSETNQPDVVLKKVKCRRVRQITDFGVRGNAQYYIQCARKVMLLDILELMDSDRQFTQFVLDEKVKDFKARYVIDANLSSLDSINMIVDNEYIELLATCLKAKQKDIPNIRTTINNELQAVSFFLAKLENTTGFEFVFDTREKEEGKKTDYRYIMLSPTDSLDLTLERKAPITIFSNEDIQHTDEVHSVLSNQ